jgi:hypothetical protein
MAPRRGIWPAASLADAKTVTAPELSKPAFPFFDLPRELRDEVYDSGLIFKQKIPTQTAARLRGRRVANPTLLQVSKQFRQEYLERAERQTCLVVVDRPEYHGESIKLPTSLSYIRKLEVHIAIACDAPDHLIDKCRVVKEMRMHHTWIASLCSQIRNLDSVSIKVVIDPHQYIDTCERHLLELQHKLTSVEELKLLEVWHCDYAGRVESAGWNFSKPRKLAMKWEERDGMLHRTELHATPC